MSRTLGSSLLYDGPKLQRDQNKKSSRCVCEQYHVIIIVAIFEARPDRQRYCTAIGMVRREYMVG